MFPPEVTRSIENALIKARTAALQQQQTRGQQDLLNRGRGVGTPPSGWRNTPTPPQAASRYAPPSANGQQHVSARCLESVPDVYLRLLCLHAQFYDNQQAENHTAYTQNQASSQSYQPPLPGPIDLVSLNQDIENLITGARADFTNNPLDPSIQQRLKALLDLQSILQRQTLPDDQLKLIRDQVSQLSTAAQQQRRHTASANPPPQVPPAAAPLLNQTTSQTPQANLQALLNPNTLAELLKTTAASQGRTPPPPPPPQPQQPPQPKPPSISATPSTTPTPALENPLIASLRARGLLPQVPSASGTPTPPNMPFILPGQTGSAQPTPPEGTSQLSTVKINVQMTSASIRV